MKWFLLVLCTSLLVSCAPQSASTPQPTPTQLTVASTENQAYEALDNFLTLLHTKKYADAVPLYGGDYEQLHIFNPEIDTADHVALWTWACENQLLQCLEVRSIGSGVPKDDSYVFQVEFNNPDGSLFVLGPCCGANETDMPPVFQFEFTVTRNTDGKFVVMNMPPYVP